MNELARCAFIFRRVFVDFACYVQLENNSVLVRRHASGIAVLEQGWRYVERHEPNSMREDFVVDNRGVVPYIDMFNGYCRYLPRFRSYIHET